MDASKPSVTGETSETQRSLTALLLLTVDDVNDCILRDTRGAKTRSMRITVGNGK